MLGNQGKNPKAYNSHLPSYSCVCLLLETQRENNIILVLERKALKILNFGNVLQTEKLKANGLEIGRKM
jgi:hypothetical protein